MLLPLLLAILSGGSSAVTEPGVLEFNIDGGPIFTASITGGPVLSYQVSGGPIDTLEVSTGRE